MVAASSNATCCKYAAIQHELVLCKEFGLEKTKTHPLFFLNRDIISKCLVKRHTRTCTASVTELLIDSLTDSFTDSMYQLLTDSVKLCYKY